MNMSSGKEATKPAQRIFALWFTHLATDRILRRRWGRSWRSDPQLSRPPLIVSLRQENTQRIAALDEVSGKLGLKVGMGIADALAMYPAIEVVEAEPETDRRLLESLADWCDRYTPLVALDGTDGLFLDITGCAHLFGGEEALLRDILERFRQQGFAVRAAVASTPGAAWAAARFCDDCVVPPGMERELLAPLPLAALRLDVAARAGLEGVGLRTVGAVMATKRAPLVRRFGKCLMINLDRALGACEEAISPRRLVPPLSVERRLSEPIFSREHVETLVVVLARALRQDLERRGEGARLLELLLFRVDGAVSRIDVGTSRPMRDPLGIERLFHERLEALEDRLDAGYGFDLVRLSALSTAPLDPLQADFVGAAREPGGDLALFADRVNARLGTGTVLRPQLIESHLPERAVRLISSGEALQAKRTLPSSSERPIRLFNRPEPVEVTLAEVPEGPPASFLWRRSRYRVVRSEGPERIEAEWWREPLSGSPARDYFRLEDGEGRRYWLFRQGHYGAAESLPRWFLHGIFA